MEALPVNQAIWMPGQKKTITRIREIGFQGIGAWSHRVLHRYNIPLSRDLNLWEWASKDTLFYDPAWLQRVEKAVSQQVIPLEQNRNLVGYFTDNELGWTEGFGFVDDYFNGLPPENPNRLEVIGIIRSLWRTTEEFNKNWQTDINDWQALENWTALPKYPVSVRRRLITEWSFHLAKDYFRITNELIRKYDPNHLILGIRYKGKVSAEVLRASTGYIDAQSINLYASDARLDRAVITAMTTLGRRPILVSEYSFHSLDGRSGNKNHFGFIWGHVMDQAARAQGYALFTRRLASLPYFIGADWFQWSDEPPGGRTDGEDVNFGVVDIYDRPYPKLVKAIKATGALVNALHKNSASADRESQWRASPKPVSLRIHYLKNPIRIEGELSDWDDQNRLKGFKYTPVVGVERSSELLAPTTYMGWRNEGLYFAAKAHDRNVLGYPIGKQTTLRPYKARSFDHIELSISTKRNKEPQIQDNTFIHDFLFSPDSRRKLGGTCMRWSSSTDPSQARLIACPKLKYTFKQTPDGYVLELFIPKKSLVGFDPKANATIWGNISVLNWQPHVSYYLSAEDPSSPKYWGPMHLITQ